jgi:hypothetical protein
MTSATVTAASAEMRQDPSADAPLVATLKQGNSVDIISDNDDGSWFLVSAVVANETRLGWVRANLTSAGAGAPAGGDTAGGQAKPAPQDRPPPQDKPPPQAKPDPVVMPGAGAKPIGNPTPFSTKASNSGNANGQSSTTGLSGTEQAFDDGSTVIEASESLAASRTGGFNSTLQAFCRRVRKGDVTTVQQDNYSYDARSPRKLPLATLYVNSSGIPADVPDGFEATPVRDVIASQFGKNDRQDEGTGTPAMGLIQTNSEIFGASIKISKMAENFGQEWRKNPRRMGTLIEIHAPRTGHRVRVPLVDVGPGETIPAEVDLCWACDQFLGTQGQGRVTYRLLIPK